MQATDVLIIGAGISGLLCATELRKADMSVRILDKGRGLGGPARFRCFGWSRAQHRHHRRRRALRVVRRGGCVSKRVHFVLWELAPGNVLYLARRPERIVNRKREA